ncbi:MAG TPA: hypothetical protein DIW23_12960 [Anaerolineae bacterium]|nr:hypothetical protein [Anaerolineae bacterium]
MDTKKIYLTELKKMECCFRAVKGARYILNTQISKIQADELHTLKSTFYVAVERLHMKADRLFSLQRQLREVLTLINMRCDLSEHERMMALQLTDEIEERLRLELSEKPTGRLR